MSRANGFDRTPRRRDAPVAVQCGFVAGAGAARLAAVEVDPVLARVDVVVFRAFDARFRVRRDFAVVVVEVAARDVTCDECLVRCLTVFLGAASAGMLTTSAATIEQMTSSSRLRSISIRTPPRRCAARLRDGRQTQGAKEVLSSSVFARCVQYHTPNSVKIHKRYASANPICATNIIRYMCAQDTWFSSTASSSGRRSMR